MKYIEKKFSWEKVLHCNTIIPANFEEVLDHYGIVPEGTEKTASAIIQALNHTRMQFFGVEKIREKEPVRILCETGTYENENAETGRKRITFLSDTKEYLPEMTWKQVFLFISEWLNICTDECKYMEQKWYG